jgi:amino acid adenylation domain-containing protein
MSQAQVTNRPASAAVRPIRQHERQYPASLGQHRFWVLDRLDPGNPALNIAVRWRLEGAVSAAQIEEAFNVIIQRHEALRTCLVEVNGEPIQVVHATVAFRVASIDLSVLNERDAYAECDSIARTEAQAPFNLAAAPLIRATHVRIDENVAILLVTTHHAVCDGWSIGLLAREMGEICRAMRANQAPRLPELPVSYGEFACWQREFIAAGGGEDVAFWSRMLEGADYFELPSDMARNPTLLSAGAIQSVLLDRSLTDALSQTSRQHGCTLFMTAVAALTTLLHRYTGATDIAIGTQVAGRSDVDVEHLVGLFINTLVLRTDLSGAPAFADLMHRVRDVVSDVLDHEAMPIEKVIESLKPKRYPGHNAVFSINFIFQRSFIHNADYGDFKLVDIPSYSPGAMHDLNFFMVERPEGWRVSCEYNTGLYEEPTIRQLLGHLVNIMKAAVENPHRPITTMPMLDAEERRQLIVEANMTEADYPSRMVLPQLITQRAALTPNAPAVIDNTRTCSYHDVEAGSEVLAQKIVGRGIPPGSRIGVFVKRSCDLVIAPLGIMRAGCAYVPLDPAYPAARITQILEQADLCAIVAQNKAVPPALNGVPIIALDEAPTVESLVEHRLPIVRPEDTAYIIFTSGSTGTPKGVEIPHRALMNFACAMRNKPGFTAHDTILAVTTICFDIAALELFLPLTVGGKVAIATESETRDGRLLMARMRRSHATVLQATPASWRMLLEAGWRGEPQLRMLCGGEALPVDLAQRLLTCGPELWNMYGPTETTIWSSVKRVSVDDVAMSLGPPIANTQFYAVDQHGELVPQGALGELLIGGDGVASGYRNMAILTADKFIPDVFRAQAGAKLYRTGDLVRKTREGNWQFLGRADNQVKIRGFRIELSEIEAVLLRDPRVRDAVALAGTAGTGETAILAYVEVTAEAVSYDQLAGDLRSAIALALPSYMRPAAITCLAAIPRLPNGKVDRKGLARYVTKPPGEREMQHPLNEVETRLKEIWCSVLGVETIDRSADFFDLGGHSLLAARLLSRVEASFGRRISLAALFDSPSFAGFASLLHTRRDREFDFRQVVRLQPGGANNGIFAVNNTGIYLTLSRLLGEALPVTALQLFDPSFPREVLPESIEAIAAEYVGLVRRLQPQGPYTFLGWCNGGVLAFEIARQLEDAGETGSRVIVVDTWLPGYIKGLGSIRSVLADYSYRFHLVAADWADVRAGRKPLGEFLAYRRTLSWLFRRKRAPDLNAEPEYVAAERFDRWLVEYLDGMLEKYQPRKLAGSMTIFRSSREPAGRFLDPKLGWAGFAEGGVEVTTVPGDHFSIFKEPGISVIARHIQTSLKIDSDTPAA